jgi:hypothetical protein
VDWGGVAAAVIAVGAAMVAVWQAHEARKARHAAERQAKAAEDSAAAMRRQTEVMEHERTARDEEDGPRFETQPARRPGQDRRHNFTLKMLEGPQVDVVATEARGAAGASGLPVSIPLEQEQPRRMVRGTPADFAVTYPPADFQMHVEVRFECIEVDGRRRSWIRWETVTFPPPARVW